MLEMFWKQFSIIMIIMIMIFIMIFMIIIIITFKRILSIDFQMPEKKFKKKTKERLDY